MKNRQLIFLYVLLVFGLCLLAMSATAQLTLKGHILSRYTPTALLYFTDGAVAPVTVHGTKNYHYDITIDGANGDYLLTFNDGGVKRAIYIHTHQPDGYLIRQTLVLDIPFTDQLPQISTVYYDPAVDEYRWNEFIPEDTRKQLKALNIEPKPRD